MLTQMMSPGVYDVPKVHFDAVTAVTNTTTTGAYRGAGRPEATQLIERVIDVAADELGIDPAELRRRNYLQPERVPADHAHRRQLRLRRVRQGARRGAGRGRLRRRCAPSRRRGASAATPCSSASACRRTSRSRRRSGCTSSTARSRCTTTARRACPSAPASTARATTRRSPCSPATSSASRWTASSSSTPTPRRVPRGAGHDGLAIAADGRQRRARGVHRGARQGQADRRQPARGRRRRHRRR